MGVMNGTAPTKMKRELVEEIWQASNLTWRQAENLVNEAMKLGEEKGRRQGRIEAYLTAARLLQKKSIRKG